MQPTTVNRRRILRTALAATAAGLTLTVAAGSASAAPVLKANPEFDGTLTCGATVYPVDVTTDSHGRAPRMFGKHGEVFLLLSTGELTVDFYNADGSYGGQYTQPAGAAAGGAATNRGGANGPMNCHFHAVTTDVWATDGSYAVANQDTVVAIVGHR